VKAEKDKCYQHKYAWMLLNSKMGVTFDSTGCLQKNGAVSKIY
jgi:hypothetical protein